MSVRPIREIIHTKATIEGAGVKLQRAFGFGNTTDFDPFLLLDDFRNDNPDDYLAGFPWHPHRGIETITYVLAGHVEHGDSLGNRGSLGSGDVQWMTAGRGIMHQEMPKGDADGHMHGFQLWANLPSRLKMTEPRYQDIKAADIPEVVDDDGTRVRIVVGEFWGRKGPVEGVAADPRYLDISVPPGQQKRIAVDRTNNAFAYVFAGSGTFRLTTRRTKPPLQKRECLAVSSTLDLEQSLITSVVRPAMNAFVLMRVTKASSTIGDVFLTAAARSPTLPFEPGRPTAGRRCSRS